MRGNLHSTRPDPSEFDDSAPDGVPAPAPRRLRAITVPACRHCGGAGKEPEPIEVEFSRSGELRGDQQRAADEMGLSASMVSHIMNGHKLGSIVSYVRLARHYRTTVDRIIRQPKIWERIRAELNQASTSSTD